MATVLSYNRTIIAGRFTADPELRNAGEKKTATVNFNIAVNRPYVDGEGKKDADFIPCVAWGKIAEFIAAYFKKGSPVLIEGALRDDSYTDKSTGKTVSKLILSVENVRFVESAGKSGAEV